MALPSGQGDWIGPKPPLVDGDTVKAKLPEGSDAGLTKVIRGGSWMTSAFGSRVTHRKYEVPKDADGPIGFRPLVPADWYLASISAH